MKYLTLVLFLFLVNACSSEEEEQEPIPEEEEITIEGDYTGTWDDNIYTAFPISARIMDQGSNSYGGPFFYSQNGSFTPCCQDEGDNGTINFKAKGERVDLGDPLHSSPQQNGTQFRSHSGD